MTLSTVTWRQAAATLAAVVVGLLAVVVVVRSDGIEALDARSARATGWFVHQPTGRVVLVDGYRGLALGTIDADARGQQISVADGTTGAYVLNDTTAEARPIDNRELRLGTPFGIAALGAGRAVSSVGQAGLVVVNPDGEATVVPPEGEPLAFSVPSSSTTQIARDGSVWSIDGRDLVRATSTGTAREDLGTSDVTLSMVGSEPLVVDSANRRVRLGRGSWQRLPGPGGAEVVVQVAGPSNSCGWVGAGDSLWCVGHDGIEERTTVDGLAIGSGDRLAIAGDAAVLVRRGPTQIVRFDWRGGRLLDERRPSVTADAQLDVIPTVDLVWIDDVRGDFVWAVNPWSIEAINKNAAGILVLGEEGDVIDEGQSDGASNPQDRVAAEPEAREPDDNGIDDPPVANDDHVTARTGTVITVDVTANDYDPDGEAIAVSSVGVPGHGTVELGTATTVVYTPSPGYAGNDRFDYTIVDGDGTEASATVYVELVPPGAINGAPKGVADRAETGAGVPVVIDVLLNDIDPERDALRLGGFSPPDAVGERRIGEVTETVGPSGLPALHFAPADGFEGTAIFTYRPVDVLSAVGDDVEVRVEVAAADTPNRPPAARPDAVRVRRHVPTPVPVLANDADPDGDVLAVSVVGPLPVGIEVDAQGDQLMVTARAAAAPYVPFEYEIDDGHGHVGRASVLVAVIDDVEPNRPPVVTADSAKVVAGESVVIDVTANDVDPDGDPLTVIAVSQPDQGGRAALFSNRQVQFTAGSLDSDDTQATARFTYTVTDGHGHEAVGEVAVTVLPDALAEPPFARDDSTFTYVDIPVTVDVLRNDGDPSGGRPSLVGRPSCPGGGLATITTDSQIRFDPPTAQSGAFRCTYEVTNLSGRRASASIIVSVRERPITNQAPVAQPDQLTVEVGSTASIDVTLNDLDPDGARSDLQVVSSTAPIIGTAQRAGNVITFTAGETTGIATINYQVADAGGAVSVGRLVVRVVERQNVAPNAVDDMMTVFAPASPQPFSVLSNDADPDQTPGGLSVVSASKVSGEGTVTLSGDTVTITPAPGYLGRIVATYTIRDAAGATASAQVILDVQQQPNRPPEARDDSAEVVSGGTVTVPVLFNDSDPDNDPLTLSIVSGPDPSIGTAVIGQNRTVVFTGVPGAAGTATITYEIRDAVASATAQVRITVLPCAQGAPIADNGFLRTGYQQPIVIDFGAFAHNGTVVEASGPPGFDGSMYTPPAGENGDVTIAYTIANACRQRASGTITIDVNQAPTARPRTFDAYRGETLIVPVTDLATDTEVLIITEVSGTPAWVSNEGSRLVVAPSTADANGAVTFSATVTDPGGLTATVDVTVVVRDRPPVANPDVVDVTSGRAATIDLVANDLDPSGVGGLQIREVSDAIITFSGGGTGTVTVQGPRRVRVNPGTGRGTATFTYTIRAADGQVSAPATVTVNAPAPPPTTTTTTTVPAGAPTTTVP